MTKQLYRWLILLHPPQFRQRFGDEILCIFDETGAGAARALLIDGIFSLLRQWTIRSGFPVILGAILCAAGQMVLGGFVWLRAIHPVVRGSFAMGMHAWTPQEAGFYLLLVAGLITAFLSAGMVTAVGCLRLCGRNGGSARPQSKRARA